MWRASAAIGESVDVAAALRDRFAGVRAPEVEVLVTEWNVKMWGRAREPVPGYFRSLDHGLFVASTLNHLIARGVPVAHIHDLIELPTERAEVTGKSYDSAPESGLFDPAPSYRPRPAALAISLYARYLLGERIESAMSGDTALGDAPAIEVSAALGPDGRLAVMLLNRDPDRAAQVALDADVSVSDWATFRRLEADGGGTATDARVVDGTAEARDGAVRVILPATTLTCLELEIRR
jgi:hypothetical protein